tara:strand:+ start:489 stop:1319 length:831 start_codon:yes stop_codon:yes gene_type:complete
MSNFIISNLNKLKNAKISNPEIDLRVLLNHSKYSQSEVILSNINENDINLKKFEVFLNRRLNNEPISKIINKKSFWKDNFYVDKSVLDPRPETEGIIEESIRIIKNKKRNLKILDIGTGSGAIAISLSREFINAEITAIDISAEAINIAKKNIIDKKIQKKIRLKKISIDDINGYFDLIVSNPPYLSKKEYDNAQIEIKNFEPKIALDGGSDGLAFYREFAEKIPKIMNKNAYLIIEIGEKQFNDCLDILNCSGLNFIKKTQDLQKKDRIMMFSKI